MSIQIVKKHSKQLLLLFLIVGSCFFEIKAQTVIDSVYFEDQNSDGIVDYVNVVFSAPIDDSSIPINALDVFELSASTSTDIYPSGIISSAPNDATILLSVDGLTELISFTYTTSSSNFILDISGNQVPDASSTAPLGSAPQVVLIDRVAPYFEFNPIKISELTTTLSAFVADASGFAGIPSYVQVDGNEVDLSASYPFSSGDITLSITTPLEYGGTYDLIYNMVDAPSTPQNTVLDTIFNAITVGSTIVEASVNTFCLTTSSELEGFMIREQTLDDFTANTNGEILLKLSTDFIYDTTQMPIADNALWKDVTNVNMSFEDERTLIINMGVGSSSTGVDTLALSNLLIIPQQQVADSTPMTIEFAQTSLYNLFDGDSILFLKTTSPTPPSISFSNQNIDTVWDANPLYRFSDDHAFSSTDTLKGSLTGMYYSWSSPFDTIHSTTTDNFITLDQLKLPTDSFGIFPVVASVSTDPPSTSNRCLSTQGTLYIVLLKNLVTLSGITEVLLNKDTITAVIASSDVTSFSLQYPNDDEGYEIIGLGLGSQTIEETPLNRTIDFVFNNDIAGITSGTPHVITYNMSLDNGFIYTQHFYINVIQGVNDFIDTNAAINTDSICVDNGNIPLFIKPTALSTFDTESLSFYSLEGDAISPPSDYNYAANGHATNVGWIYDPSKARLISTDGISFIGDIISIYAVPYGTSPLNAELEKQFLGTFALFVYSLPSIRFTNPEFSVSNPHPRYCSTDGVFNIQTEIRNQLTNITTFANIENGYQLQYNDSDNTFPSATTASFDFTSSSGNLKDNFNPNDPNQDGDVGEDEAGFYRIIWSNISSGDNFCVNTDTSDYFIVTNINSHPKLNTVGFENNVSINSDSSEYLLEFCAGDVIPDLEVLISETPGNSFSWYDAATSTSLSDIKTLFSSNIFAGTNSPTSPQTKKLFLTRTIEDCESDTTTIEITIYSYYDPPLIETTSIDYLNFEDDIYYLEYCSEMGREVTFDGLTITSSLKDPFGRVEISNRTYIEILDRNNQPLDSIRYSGLDDEQYTLNLNNYSLRNITGMMPNDVVTDVLFLRIVYANHSIEGESFSGCTSEIIELHTFIYTNAEDPGSENFGVGKHAVVDASTGANLIQYYVCIGDFASFPNISIADPIGGNNFQYEWFKSVADTDPVMSSNNGKNITLQNLIDADFDTTSVGAFDIYVRTRANINTASGYQGCESDFDTVRILVLPIPDAPEITAQNPTSTIEMPLGSKVDKVFNYCVDRLEGLDANEEFYATATYNGVFGNGFDWYESDAQSNITNLVRITSGDVVTANQLSLDGLTNVSRFFAIIHNTEIVEGFSDFSGCISDTTFIQVIVSATPVPKFKYNGITINRPTTFTFYDSAFSTIATNGLVFTIKNDAGALLRTHESSTVDPVDFSLTTPGKYEGTLSIITDGGCEVTTSRSFQILDKIIITDGYHQSFDNDNGGWFAEIRSDNGYDGTEEIPGRINSWAYGEKNGQKGWHTGITGTYKSSEISFLYTPAFDVSRFNEKLGVSFQSLVNLDSDKDGVVMQVSYNDGKSWHTIGDYEAGSSVEYSGQNWYNNNGITSSPGNTRVGFEISATTSNPLDVGWSDGGDDSWKRSVHFLTLNPSIDSLRNVRIRFALSSSAGIEAKQGLGFSIDDFRFYKAQKTVILEQFFSMLLEESKFVGDSIHYKIPSKVAINYFTHLGNGETSQDFLNARNSSTPDARATYYGISKVPNSVLDGEVFPQKDTLNWSQRNLDIKELNELPFTIPSEAITVSLQNGVLRAQAKFQKQSGDFINPDLSVLFAVKESRVFVEDIPENERGVYSAGDTLFDVVRTILPSPAGIYVDKDFIESGEILTFSVEWTVSNLLLRSGIGNTLGILCFIQDNTTKEVYQAVFANIPVSEIVAGVEDDKSVSLYPNPAVNNVILELGSTYEKDVEVLIYDNSGRQVKRFVVPSNTSRKTFDVSKLTNGLYLLIVEDIAYTGGRFKKLLINR